MTNVFLFNLAIHYIIQLWKFESLPFDLFFSFIPLKITIIPDLNFVSDILFMFCLEEKSLK